MIEDLWQGWDGSIWTNFLKFNKIYDSNNNMIEDLRQDWDGTNWVDRTRSIFTYSPITGIEVDNSNINTFQLSNNYPNPFNPTTTIRYSIPNQSNVTLQVFDGLGKKLDISKRRKTCQGNYEIEFNAIGTFKRSIFL